MKIIEKTNLKIVLSSTWRLKYDIEFMQNIFQELGIKGEIIDFTPD